MHFLWRLGGNFRLKNSEGREEKRKSNALQRLSQWPPRHMLCRDVPSNHFVKRRTKCLSICQLNSYLLGLFFHPDWLCELCLGCRAETLTMLVTTALHSTTTAFGLFGCSRNTLKTHLHSSTVLNWFGALVSTRLSICTWSRHWTT